MATDFRYRVVSFFRVPKPNTLSSRRIYAYADKIHKSSGGAPDKLVAMYKAYGPRNQD